MMQCLGYFPDLHTDALSGQPIQPDLRYQFVVNSGFVSCAEDARDSVSGYTVVNWRRGDYQQDTVLRLAKSVLRSTIDFNLQGKTLKSREVYAQMMRRK
jgi:DNA repair protein RecO (recombination protein O)